MLASAKPSLLRALAEITSMPTRVGSGPQTTTHIVRPPADSAGWQDHWIAEYTSADHTSPPTGALLLHHLVPAIRLTRKEGEWVIPVEQLNGGQDAGLISIHDRQYSVSVATPSEYPEDVASLTTAWVLAGTDSAWGIPVSHLAQQVLTSLDSSSKVPGWHSEWIVIEPSQVAAVLAFGPYSSRVASYDEAVADATSQDAVASLAVGIADADVVILGFGTNLPSTRLPISRAGRTS